MFQIRRPPFPRHHDFFIFDLDRFVESGQAKNSINANFVRECSPKASGEGLTAGHAVPAQARERQPL
jgi:hypothetical protein